MVEAEKNFVVLGLGSNLGNREFFLQSAIEKLNLYNLRISKIYNTKALLPDHIECPADWNKDFLNCAVCGNTNLNLNDFFKLIRTIEIQLKREKSLRWAPRVIDLDILFWNNSIFSSEDLIIPHKEIVNRDFVLKPLSDIIPNYIHPVLSKTVLELLLLLETRKA